jgi:hypothetical protein
MATLTTRERGRRGTQYVIGTVAVIALIASFVLHRQLLSAHPSALWLPSVAGLAYGSLLWSFGSRRNSKWLANLTSADWLIIFWALLATKLVSAPAWFISVMVGALAVTALFPKKPAPSSVKKVAIEDVRPWSGSEVAATPTAHDTRRRQPPQSPSPLRAVHPCSGSRNSPGSSTKKSLRPSRSAAR